MFLVSDTALGIALLLGVALVNVLLAIEKRKDRQVMLLHLGAALFTALFAAAEIIAGLVRLAACRTIAGRGRRATVQTFNGEASVSAENVIQDFFLFSGWEFTDVVF